MTDIMVGGTVKRIWGDGYLETEMRVVKMDDEFIYCDAAVGQPLPDVLPLPDEAYWKFDLVYGVETDEEAGWGIATDQRPGLRNIVLTRITPSVEEGT